MHEPKQHSTKEQFIVTGMITPTMQTWGIRVHPQSQHLENIGAGKKDQYSVDEI